MSNSVIMNGIDVPVWTYNCLDDKPLGYLNVEDFMYGGYYPLPDEIEIVRTLAMYHEGCSQLISKYNREILNNTHTLVRIDDFYICLLSPHMLFNGIIEIIQHVYHSGLVRWTRLDDVQKYWGVPLELKLFKIGWL